jgi:hypothetical protein
MFLKSSLQMASKMRTKWQQKRMSKVFAMLNDLKDICLRAGPTLVQDALGATSLIVMLVVGLHIPGLL